MEEKVTAEEQQPDLAELLVSTQAELNARERQLKESEQGRKYLITQLHNERERFGKALRHYRRKRLRSLRWPAVVLVVASFLEVLAMLGMMYQLVDPRAGYPLAGVALVCCSIAAGVVWERASR